MEALNAATIELTRALETFGRIIHETKVAKGWAITTPESWGDLNQIPADLALVHSEVSEALEAFREGNVGDFSEEMTDVAIRVIGLCHGLDIDLAGYIAHKVEKNRDRPVKHGGKRI